MCRSYVFVFLALLVLGLVMLLVWDNYLFKSKDETRSWVLHDDKLVHTANFGFRDHAAKLLVEGETIFPGCSLTKAMISATLGVLVDEGALTWDTRVEDVLPDLNIEDEILHEFTTIIDLLAHQTGMSASNYWLGSQNNILIAKEDSLRFLSSQKSVKPFRGQWQYNNLGYELAGLVIEEISGQRWDEVLKSKILELLGLNRTSAMAEDGDGNTAKAYGVLANDTPTKVDGVKAAADKFGGANGGIRSCVSDLLKIYQELMRASKGQFTTGQASTPGSPLKQVTQLLSSRIPLKKTSLRGNSYAFGWVRSQLPSSLGVVGLNPKLLPQGMPIVNKGGISRLLLYHQGSLPGALTAVNLLPKTQSAIVVMTNTLALGDCADWVGQLALEAVLGVKDKNHYVDIAKRSVANALTWHSNIEVELKKDQVLETHPQKLTEYTGTNVNPVNIMKIKVTLADNKLYFALQSLESGKFKPTHYQYDIFTWLRTRDELAQRGRFTHQEAPYYKLGFGTGDDGMIGSIAWTHDTDIPDGETFEKESQTSMGRM